MDPQYTQHYGSRVGFTFTFTFKGRVDEWLMGKAFRSIALCGARSSLRGQG